MIGDYLEVYTFDYLMDRALSQVPDALDKRQGSIIYDALAPAITEVAQFYMELRNCKKSASISEASYEDLTELASQNGVFRIPAVNAVRLGTFDMAIPIGSRFSINDIPYLVISRGADDYSYKLECEVPGIIGNAYFGDLLPISYIADLGVAKLGDIITYGSDEETDDDLRYRYKQQLVNPPQDGNTAQYIQWAKSFSNVGTCKIFPLWNGGNSVKIAITDKMYEPASADIVNSFQQYMDPGSRGLGEGQAPIGSKVTVVSGTKRNIDVTGTIILAEGYSQPEGVSNAIAEYLRSITYLKSSVNYIRIVNAILNCDSIADVGTIQVNGGAIDIALTELEIPYMNNLNLTVVSE